MVGLNSSFSYFILTPFRHLSRQFNFGSAFRYRRVLTMVVESGLIYSSAILIEITLYFLNSNAFYIVYDPIAQLTVSD